MIAHTLAKIGWMIVYILVYGIRPLIIRPKPVGLADVINWGLVLSFDGALLYTLGFKSLLYLVLGTVFGGGLHPIAGHLIQEHYMFVTVSKQACRQLFSSSWAVDSQFRALCSLCSLCKCTATGCLLYWHVACYYMGMYVCVAWRSEPHVHLCHQSSHVFVLTVQGQETYSYYGPLNCFTYNVGYHNEHHDFPQIPQTRLHAVSRRC